MLLVSKCNSVSGIVAYSKSIYWQIPLALQFGIKLDYYYRDYYQQYLIIMFPLTVNELLLQIYSSTLCLYTNRSSVISITQTCWIMTRVGLRASRFSLFITASSYSSLPFFTVLYGYILFVSPFYPFFLLLVLYTYHPMQKLLSVVTTVPD